MFFFFFGGGGEETQKSVSGDIRGHKNEWKKRELDFTSVHYSKISSE